MNYGNVYIPIEEQRLRVTRFFESISNYKMRCECTRNPSTEQQTPMNVEQKTGRLPRHLGNLQTEYQNKQNQYFPIQNAKHTAKNSTLWHPLENVHRYSVGILYANHFLFVHGFKMQNGSSNRSFEILLEFVRSLWPANVFCWRKK